MKKDFSQPFQTNPTHYVSVFAQLARDGQLANRFALGRHDDDPQEYTPFYIQATDNTDITSAIAAELHKHGLVLTYLRKVTTGADVYFTFIDDAPGTVENSTCYYAVVDLAEQHGNLVYLTPNELAAFLPRSSFLDKTEITAAAEIMNMNTIISQR